MRMLILRPHLQLQPPSCSLTSSNSFLHSFKPHRRFHFIKPCSSLKQTKKQDTLQKSNTRNAPRSLGWFFNPKGDGGGGDDKNNNKIKGNGDAETESGGIDGDSAAKGTILAGVLLVGVVAGFASVGYVYKDQINAF